MSSIIITTIDAIPGRTIVEHYGLVCGSSVRSKHIGSDILAGIKNIAGGELKNYTKLMDETRNEAISRLCQVATDKGANAVLGVRFSSSDVAAGAAEIVAYGTAVRLV